MALTAGYIAVGSGFASVREYFEMTELQFFDAWPLKLLMGLLIATLVVVTWKRIPLTPPRYGVWCVHIGIITLILGTSFYYNRKLEGRVRLFTNAAAGPVSTDHFYDKDERSLYVKVNDAPWSWYPLPRLPRFKDYDQSLDNADELAQRGLHDISPTAALRDDPSAPTVNKTLSQWMQWKDPVKFDIVGYYTYAQTTTQFVDDPTSSTTGVRLTVPDVHEDQDVQAWVVQADPRIAISASSAPSLSIARPTPPPWPPSPTRPRKFSSSISNSPATATRFLSNPAKRTRSARPATPSPSKISIPPGRCSALTRLCKL